MKNLRFILFNIIAVLAAMELCVYLCFLYPRFTQHLPQALHTALQQTYMDSDMNMPQWSKECSRFDSQLVYTLKPGACRLSNREFETTLQVNSLGTRDSEEAIQGSSIVVLGDSVAMGWGVAGDESFTELLEEQTGLRTLNAAISSYGTAREVLLFDRVDISQLKYLVVQYSINDYKENIAFEIHARHLPVMDEKHYLELRDKMAFTRGYFPGKFAVSVLYYLGRITASRISPAAASTEIATPEDHAQALLQVLEHGLRSDLTNVQLIVIPPDDNVYPQTKMFSFSLSKLAKSGQYRSLIRQLEILDITELPKGSFFVLDQHPNSLGHKSIADRLSLLISRSSLPAPKR